MNALQRFIILALLPQFGMSQTCIPRPTSTRVDPLYTNQRLDGYQVSHLMGFTLERCALECFLVRLCASFNFREHQGVCALNNVTVGDVGEDKLVSETDFVHHELQAWNDHQTMAGTCASRPCDENQRCIQTTPVHTCVAVDCGPPPRYIEPHRLKDALVTSSAEVTSVGSRAEYTCDGHWIGYQYNFEAPFYNSSTKICNSDFTWSKNKPVCSIVWAVNCGGDAHTDSNDIRYQKDFLNTGFAYGKPLQIENVESQDQVLYQTWRFSRERRFSYDVPIYNDDEYVLVLKFVEMYVKSPNQRVFDVKLNGMHTVIHSLDIFAKVGKNAPYDVEVPFTVRNGKLRVNGETSNVSHGKVPVQFVKVIENPTICAMHVMRAEMSKG